MSQDSLTETSAADQAPQITPSDLLDNLRELGQALPVSFQPTSHDAGYLTAGLVWYLATGSLVAPRVDVPDQAQVNADLHEQTRLNEAEAEIAALQRQLAAQGAGPAAVAPAPIVPAEPTPTPPAPPVDGETPKPNTFAVTEAGVDPEALKAAEALIAASKTPPTGTVGS